MIVDPSTLSKFPHFKEIASTPANVIASFYGVNNAQVKPNNLVINPGIRSVLDKAVLYEKLSVNGYPLPKFHTAKSFIDQEAVLVDELMNCFGDATSWPVSPIMVRNNSSTIAVHNLTDALSKEVRKAMKMEGAVVTQSAFTSPKWSTVALFTTITPSVGFSFYYKDRMHSDGTLFASDLPDQLRGEIIPTLRGVGEYLDLDVLYGLVAYEQDAFEIHNVHCQLDSDMIVPVGSYVKMLLQGSHKQLHNAKQFRDNGGRHAFRGRGPIHIRRY